MFDSVTLTFDLSVPKALRQLVRPRSSSTPSAVSLASFAVELKYGHAHTRIKLEGPSRSVQGQGHLSLTALLDVITSAKEVMFSLCLFVCFLAGLCINYSIDFHKNR